MKISLIQMNTQERPDANLAQAERLIDAAVAEDRPDVVLLPEMFTMLSENLEAKRANAEVLPQPGSNAAPGKAYALLRQLAAKHRVHVHGGSLLERDGDRFFNTSVAFDRDGREVARYRKIHLFDVVTPDGKEYRESANVGRGTEIVTYQLEGHTVGMSVCYDMRFPELYQALAKRGAEIIVIPSAFTLQTGKDHWEPILRARAIETETYVLAAAQCGGFANGNRLHYGHSLVVDPWGHVMARAQDTVGFVTARLDFDYLKDVRQRIPVHQHKVL
ncbi:MAG: carbon-nitrogen hydrolase family protein [Alphaproteobacteria bacterium]|nr:carbon-nitrogen hydrolase family protein [Alphaproteobacteria bacterium]